MNKLFSYGYSGDKIEVLSSKSGCYVNKTISSHARGLIAAEKQASFQAIRSSNISLEAVPILSTFSSGDSFFIKMPFLSGLSGIDLMTCGSAQLARNIGMLLNIYFARLATNSIEKSLDKSIIEQKLDEISTKAPAKYRVLMDNFADCLTKLPQEISYPHSDCHGDLTLSNMISFGDTIFLIDFIPSTVDSFLSDFAKIEQDLLYGWSYRFCNRFIQSDAKVFCALIKLGYKLAVSKCIRILSLINWFRIIPYIEDEQTDDPVAITIEIVIL